MRNLYIYIVVYIDNSSESIMQVILACDDLNLHSFRKCRKKDLEMMLSKSKKMKEKEGGFFHTKSPLFCLSFMG